MGESGTGDPIASVAVVVARDVFQRPFQSLYLLLESGYLGHQLLSYLVTLPYQHLVGVTATGQTLLSADGTLSQFGNLYFGGVERLARYIGGATHQISHFHFMLAAPFSV